MIDRWRYVEGSEIHQHTAREYTFVMKAIARYSVPWSLENASEGDVYE